MEGHKDISDMSFEEFFSEKDRAPAPQPAARREPARRGQREAQGGDVQTGFGAVSPKINYKDRGFLLYVPRYGSDANARFEAAIDCAAGVIPMGRLDSAPRGAGRLSRSSTLDLTAAGVSPLEPFTLIIDGQDAFRYRPRGVIFFNNIGLPMGKPVGETYAVYPRGKSLRLVKTEVLETFEVAGVMVSRMEVSTAGGIWLDDRRREGRQEQDAPAEAEAAEAEPAPEVQEEKPKAKPKKRKKPTGSIRLPAGIADMDVMCGGEVIPAFTSFPAFRVSVENRDLDECAVSLVSFSGEELAGGNAPVDAPMTFDTDLDGVLDIVLSCEGAVLARARFAYMPDLEASRPGKGDLTPETVFRYTLFGEERTADAYADPAVISRNGADIAVRWIVPAVTYDIGEGPVRYDPSADIPEVDVDALGDTMVVTVAGARKKSLFIGPDKGKKRDITPDWSEDTCRIPTEAIREEIFTSDAPSYTLYITVNSFPMRRFMVIRNPVRMKARLEGGSIVAEVSQSGEYVCRMYKIDKSVETVQLQGGESSVPVPEGTIEAEVAELHGGRDRNTIHVPVMQLPFLRRDEAGDLWLYVSRSKRIPLPGDLASAKPEAARIRQWHDQIVRMNPELRNVTSAMMQRAFDEMQW